MSEVSEDVSSVSDLSAILAIIDQDMEDTINAASGIQATNGSQSSFQDGARLPGMSQSLQPSRLQGIESHRSGAARGNKQEKNKNSYIPQTIARVVILEEPAQYVRFRYASENLYPGTPGKNSTSANKTFPTIQIQGQIQCYKGPVVVVVSCVTKDAPFRAHPHSLVGEDCRNGIFQKQMTSDDTTISFPKLNIQCTLKKNVKEKLEVRQKQNVDPCSAGFDHCERADELDMDSVRLCFQVFLNGSMPLHPVVSQPIFNSKLFSSLKICKLSHGSAKVGQRQEMMLFCEKINKDDIEILFYEESNNIRTWEARAEFQPSDVHKGYGISFRTPSYKTNQIDDTVRVFIQLRQPSTQATGEPLPFQLTPVENNPPKRKYVRSQLNTGRQITPEALVLSTMPQQPPTNMIPPWISTDKHNTERSNVESYAHVDTTNNLPADPPSGLNLGGLYLQPQSDRRQHIPNSADLSNIPVGTQQPMGYPSYSPVPHTGSTAGSQQIYSHIAEYHPTFPDVSPSLAAQLPNDHQPSNPSFDIITHGVQVSMGVPFYATGDELPVVENITGELGDAEFLSGLLDNCSI